MPAGVLRPYTLADVLGTLSGQQSQQGQQGQQSVTGVGYFVEANETMPMADSMSTTVQAMPGWDGGVWGGFSWG